MLELPGIDLGLLFIDDSDEEVYLDMQHNKVDDMESSFSSTSTKSAGMNCFIGILKIDI